MTPVILYRDFDMDPKELAAMRKYFFVTDSRMDIRTNDLVVGRYSVLPFYSEQEKDIRKAGARLINTFDQHDYIADIRRWYADLYNSGDDDDRNFMKSLGAITLGRQLTPRTWFTAEAMMADTSYNGPYVVKGITNSKKHSWLTHMFALNKSAAMDVMIRLQEDSLIGQQPIIFREYVPLEQLGVGVNWMPITKEFRFFFCNGELLCGAFYWSSHVEDIESVPSADEVPLAFLGEVNAAIRDKTNFVVVDVARTEAGHWMVIELNDGQMSGLSENDPDVLYKRLAEVLK